MTTETKPRKERVHYSARERAAAVLSIWTERRRPSEVCKEMAINTAMLMQWEDRALSGMLQSLQPRSRSETEKGPALSAKLERLLARQLSQGEGKLARLERRLLKLQEDKPAVPPKEK